MLLIFEPTETAGAGATRPRLCRLSDEEFYYVKGRSLTPNGLVNEYLSASFGKLLGLPIPDFELAEWPKLTKAFQTDVWNEVVSELGFGPLFASKRVPNLMEIDLARTIAVPEKLKRDVAAFDYWVGNADRVLTESGGNPNLFWDLKSNQLIVLDHNLSFDQSYSLEEMLELHIFREELRLILTDDSLKNHYSNIYAEKINHWDDIVKTIPDSWLYSDEMQTMDAGIDFSAKRSWLERLCHPGGWGN